MVLSPKSGIFDKQPSFRIRDLNDKASHSRIFCFPTLDCRFCKRPFFWKKNHGVASPKSKDFLCGLYWLFSFLFFIEQMVDLYRIYAESQSGFSKLKSFFRIHNIQGNKIHAHRYKYQMQISRVKAKLRESENFYCGKLALDLL